MEDPSANSPLTRNNSPSFGAACSQPASNSPIESIPVNAEPVDNAAVDDDASHKYKVVSALFVVGNEAEGSVTFPSREKNEFRYRLTLTKSERIKVWIEECASKHQW